MPLGSEWSASAEWTDLQGWQQGLTSMEAEWRSIATASPAPISDWERAMSTMEVAMRTLEREGHWASGPTDLLAIARRAHDELVHSNILAWLLTPAALHGLGSSLIAALLDKTWSARLEPEWPVRVRREVGRKDAERHRIADVVVDAGPTRLVIENKVHSKEDACQCEDLYWLWTEPSADDERVPERVLFVLLTLHGRPPASVCSDEAASAWRSLDHAWIAGWLDAHIKDISRPVARSSAAQYLISLRRVQRRP